MLTLAIEKSRACCFHSDAPKSCPPVAESTTPLLLGVQGHHGTICTQLPLVNITLSTRRTYNKTALSIVHTSSRHTAVIIGSYIGTALQLTNL